MSDRAMNILRSIVFFFIAVCCMGLKSIGIASADAKWPYVGVILGVFLGIAYLKQAFSR